MSKDIKTVQEEKGPWQVLDGGGLQAIFVHYADAVEWKDTFGHKRMRIVKLPASPRGLQS